MKEFTLQVEDIFKRGLRTDSRIERGLHMLEECANLKPTEFGLIPYETISDPFLSGEFSSNSITIAPPYPQVFRGKNKTLLADSAKIYSVDESNWSLTLLGDGSGKFINPEDVYGSTVAISAGTGAWHFIDLGDEWFLINGVSTVFLSNIHNLIPDDTSNIYINTAISINTGTYFKGRIMLGGFNSSNFWNNDWQDMFTKWKQGRTAGMNIGDSIGTNYVMWSSIGGGDFPLWLFFPDLALRGNVRGSTKVGYDEPGNTMILDMVRKNEFGFMPMPWQGSVILTKPLGNSIIVYGDNGITALTPVLEPIPTYGVREISNEFGILSRGSAGGDENGHIFINEDGYMYSLSPDLSLGRLGYREFFTGFSTTKTVVSYDPDDKEFYISDDSNSYVLTRSGLGEAAERVTSLVIKDGTLSGVIEDQGVATGQVVIDIGNLGTLSIKSIENVLVDYFGSATITVAIDYRYGKTGSFTRTSFFPVNKEGVSFPKISGVDFKLVIKASVYGNMDNLNGVEFNVKFSDKRYRRGIGASAVAS